MRNRRNYYRILHVQPDAPAEVIRSSFRALMLDAGMHPDRGGDSSSAALLNEAYAVLSDPDRRAEYDGQLLQQRGAPPRDGRAASSPSPSPVAAPPSARCPFCGAAAARDAERCPACASPLVAVRVEGLDGTERRAAARLARRVAVRLHVDWRGAAPIAARLEDVSPRGLRLRIDRALEIGRVIKVDAGPLQATGRVARCVRAAGSWSAGIELLTFSAEPGWLVSARG